LASWRLGGFLFLVAAANACGRPSSAATTAEKIPEVREVDVKGVHAVMTSQKGHPVIVNFWATWCGPCIEEFPAVVEGARTWRKKGVRFVSISADDPKDLPKVKKVLERFGAPFDAVLIASGKAGPAIIEDVDPDWSGALPTTFLYDADGARTARKIGALDAKILEDWLKNRTK
jgi:thiol-disulfide isomerase/thioredoxin